MYQPTKIYVASSWRCSRQPFVVDTLRDDGHEVYDFRAPKGPGSRGFSWHELDASIPPGPADLDLPAHQIRAMLAHPIADDGFESDMGALRTCDICVLVLPCGRSAHLEAGWAAGAGKLVAVLLDDGEPDLMWKMAAALCVTVDELRAVCRGSDLEAAA
jgi:hypothetical protein